MLRFMRGRAASTVSKIPSQLLRDFTTSFRSFATIKSLGMEITMPVVIGNTEVLPVDGSKIGDFIFRNPDQSFLGDWDLKLARNSPDATNLARAAQKLRCSDIPVAFPTETVYGLGADATRSAAVHGIFEAKQRPADNPLIVHVCSLRQLHDLFNPSKSSENPIPAIYLPLIRKFWPGALSILMPLPTPSPFAPEVTVKMNTVGVRMPSSPLALALIYLTDRPLAAPSANTSSKPSPTVASHVFHDLSGRIETIVDGGCCNLGLESTVVDGTCKPPLILRPGAISFEMIKCCAGWEDVRLGYGDEVDTSTPRAPGMKYKHYSPQARVILVRGELNIKTVQSFVSGGQSFGILRARKWANAADMFKERHIATSLHGKGIANGAKKIHDGVVPTNLVINSEAHASKVLLGTEQSQQIAQVWTIALGNDMTTIARSLFSALRQLDHKGVDIIFAEAIDNEEGGSAAAVRNRLQKAAEEVVDNR